MNQGRGLSCTKWARFFGGREFFGLGETARFEKGNRLKEKGAAVINKHRRGKRGAPRRRGQRNRTRERKIRFFRNTGFIRSFLTALSFPSIFFCICLLTKTRF